MEETAGQRRVVGVIWVLSAIVSLGVAVSVQPVNEWGFFTWLVAAAMLLLGITGAWVLVTGQGHLWNERVSAKARRTYSIIGLVAASVFVVGNLIIDAANWTAGDVISVGVWVAIGGMFVVTLLIGRGKSGATA